MHYRTDTLGVVHIQSSKRFDKFEFFDRSKIIAGHFRNTSEWSTVFLPRLLKARELLVYYLLRMRLDNMMIFKILDRVYNGNQIQ